MATRFYCKVFLRKDQLKRDGTAPLALRISINSQIKVFSLLQRVRVEHFIADREIVKIPGDATLTQRLNSLITQQKSKADAIFWEAEFSGEVLTLSKFTDLFANNSLQHSFIDFVKKEIESARGDKSPETITVYETALKYVIEYWSTKSRNIYFADLNNNFLQGFEKYLKKRNLSANTRYKYHKTLKSFINRAIAKGRKIVNPYNTFKIKQTQNDRVCLDGTELQTLIDLYYSKKLQAHLQRVLRYFLFSCVCGGLRISDLKRLTVENIVGDNLVFAQYKGRVNTGAVISVYINELAKYLLNDREDKKKALLFDCVSDQKSNDNLKVIADIAGIEKSLTNHVARHTFATIHYHINKDILTLKKILGHRKLETTLIYTQINYQQKVDSMKAFDELFKFNKPLFKVIKTG